MKSWGIRMKVILQGYGLMGKKVAKLLREDEKVEIVAIVSYQFDEEVQEKTYKSMDEVSEDCDVVIDFSHPNNLDSLLTYSLKHHNNLVIATTGFNDEQLNKIKEASSKLAIFQSFNTSFGIQMMTKILKQVSKELYDAGFDIEIEERHHHKKIDAPSGTAKLLADVIHDEIPETYDVLDRSAIHEKRKHEEVGIQSLRGGTIFGEHEIMFAGEDEIISIKHTALSKDVFARGAFEAAKALRDKENGLYDLKNIY